VFFVAYIVDLALWPFVATHRNLVPSDQPWIFFLVNVAGVAAVVAFPLGVQVAWALIGPFLYGTVRLLQGEFRSDFWVVTAFDVSFTLILGLVLVALGWMFRSVANGVDDARGRAVALYTAAAAAEAAEHERVAVAALMHDSVLAALIAAERAETDRARALAVDMAREALTRLANAEAPAQEGSEEPVQIELLVEDLRVAVRQMGLSIEVEHFGHGAVPDRVARAMALAARQAIGNAVAHASGRGLAVVVEGHGDTGLTVKVSDTGGGFDPAQVGPDRLGIRASILARMAAVGGVATIDSDRHGTVVTLGWSHS
jgi:signal transduction histidine kinase